MSPRISTRTRSIRNAIITQVYGLRPRIAIGSPSLPPIAGHRLRLPRRQFHGVRSPAHLRSAIPAESIRLLQAHAAEGAVDHRRGRSALRRRGGRFQGFRWRRRGLRGCDRGRGRGPRSRVKHGPTFRAALGIFRDQGTADGANVSAEHDPAAAETQVSIRLKLQIPARVELERTAGIELQGPARVELELAVRIEVQEVGHALHAPQTQYSALAG